MTGAVLYPSLSEDGWISSTSKSADLLFSHFFVSNYSQSYVYAGYVSSFPYILAINHGDISAIIQATRKALEDLFGRFFQNVDVAVTEIPNAVSPSQVQLEIVVNFTDYANVQCSLGDIIKMSNSTFERVAKINNG